MKATVDVLLIRDHCARCFRRLSGPTTYSPPYVVNACTDCHYNNVLGAVPTEFPLEGVLAHAGLSIGQVWPTGPPPDADLLEATLRAVLEPIRVAIGRERALQQAAAYTAIRMHVEAAAAPETRRGDLNLERTVWSRVAALLYLHVVDSGPFELDAAREATQLPAFPAYWEGLSMILSEAAAIGSYLFAARRGHHQIETRDGRPLIRLTTANLAEAEWAWNEPDRSRNPQDGVWLRNVDEAVRQYRGFGPSDFIRCVVSAAANEQQRKPEDIPDSIWLPESGAPPEDVRLLNAHSFTPTRFSSLAWPWFYDLAPSRDRPMNVLERIESAMTDKWLAYFPLLPMRWRGQDGFFGVDHFITAAIDNLTSSKSHLLGELVNHRHQAVIQPDGPERIKVLGQELNRLLEKQVAAAFKADDGWEIRPAATHSSKEGKEEIDLLAFHQAGEVDVAFVVEAKDFDFSFGSVNGPAHLRQKAISAQDQVMRKAAFVRATPRIIEDAFHPSGPVVGRVAVVPLVVTREGLPLAMFDRVYAVAVNELPDFLKLMHSSPQLALDMLGRQRPA